PSQQPPSPAHGHTANQPPTPPPPRLQTHEIVPPHRCGPPAPTPPASHPGSRHDSRSPAAHAGTCHPTLTPAPRRSRPHGYEYQDQDSPSPTLPDHPNHHRARRTTPSSTATYPPHPKLPYGCG